VEATSWACSVADLTLGIALLIGRATRVVLGLMLVMVALYTLGIGVLAPSHWLDPFGGLLKNFTLAAVAAALLTMDAPRR
jgi:uncharacterized membrane protein YphA (DoxX/SURF4 family)